MFYTIGEMANLLSMPASTLRFYDKKGLLPFVARSNGGIRLFKESDYETLKIIECLKKSGLTLDEVKAFMDLASKGDKTIDARLEIFQKRKEEVEKELLEVHKTLEVLNYKCWYYQQAKLAGSESIHRKIDSKDIPEDFKNVKKELKMKEALKG